MGSHIEDIVESVSGRLIRILEFSSYSQKETGSFSYDSIQSYICSSVYEIIDSVLNQ